MPRNLKVEPVDAEPIEPVEGEQPFPILRPPPALPDFDPEPSSFTKEPKEPKEPTEEAIAKLAYKLWESSGRHGSDAAHWETAKAILEADVSHED